jgi:signal transduction histidine kinase
MFSILIYYFSVQYTENDFYSKLKTKAANAARLNIDAKGKDSSLLSLITKNKGKMNGEDIMIFDSITNKKIYDSNDTINVNISQNDLINFEKKDTVKYKKDNRKIIAIDYSAKNHNNYIVVASAVDVNGTKRLYKLKLFLIIGLISGAIIAYFTGRFFAGRALNPISKVVSQVNDITTSKLDYRLNTGNSKDEIATLAITFNKMLERLESGFNVQKMFVSNASHEFRTPLSLMLGEIELSLMKERTNKEYAETLTSVADDLKRLNDLSDGLLQLTRASLDASTFQFGTLRVDELLLQSRTDLLNRSPENKIHIEFKNLPEDEALISVSGNEQLLITSFTNLMSNACKFSDDKTVFVILSTAGRAVQIEFKDNGIGIPENETANIFEPFYRASNIMNRKGNGLGLSLVKKITELHKGNIQIASAVNKGSTFTVFLPV